MYRANPGANTRTNSGANTRALGILLGFTADRVLGDPRRYHPVAGFGRTASRLEPHLYADTRASGTAYTAILVGTTTVLGLAAERLTRKHPLLHTAATAGATWTVLGARSLEREAETMATLLHQKDVEKARDRLSHLCARDATTLEADELARATVESIAENTSDACVAPLFWGGVFGIPGLLGYRAANTLDAMVGYRSPKYENFGWAAARLDDVLNLLPARLCAALTGLMAGRPRQAARIRRRDAAQHPSPNAGPVEASFAGALNLTLGGTNSYGTYTENRGTLGDGPPPTVPDIRRTATLAKRVGLAAAAGAAVVALLQKGQRWG
ncbi:cobalamin biosynthesis protein [Kribbella jejuensis]|uniref:Cobalamin biosynthesis protein CobD n=1 Tax=Kribbella jejuensis TaxID=236068 RepID=A0A542D9M3_9ACTN|nr:cobalamin biosynthesis protein [Kribbella jejuensis]TQI99768.1 adenosylcobinamide-phosphate synthase [Kribbella jejuensis]